MIPYTYLNVAVLFFISYIIACWTWTKWCVPFKKCDKEFLTVPAPNLTLHKTGQSFLKDFTDTTQLNGTL